NHGKARAPIRLGDGGAAALGAGAGQNTGLNHRAPPRIMTDDDKRQTRSTSSSVPQTMLSQSSPDVPQTMLSPPSTDVPHTMLSPLSTYPTKSAPQTTSWVQRAVPQTMLSPRSTLPAHTVSASISDVPQTMLSPSSTVHHATLSSSPAPQTVEGSHAD